MGSRVRPRVLAGPSLVETVLLPPLILPERLHLCLSAWPGVGSSAMQGRAGNTEGMVKAGEGVRQGPHKGTTLGLLGLRSSLAYFLPLGLGLQALVRLVRASGLQAGHWAMALLGSLVAQSSYSLWSPSSSCQTWGSPSPSYSLGLVSVGLVACPDAASAAAPRPS